MKLTDALKRLDPKNEDHWTQDGQPRVDVLRGLTQDPDLSRDDIIDAAPELTRESAPELVAEPGAGPVEDADPVGQDVVDDLEALIAGEDDPEGLLSKPQGKVFGDRGLNQKAHAIIGARLERLRGLRDKLDSEVDKWQRHYDRTGRIEQLFARGDTKKQGTDPGYFKSAQVEREQLAKRREMAAQLGIKHSDLIRPL